MANDPIRLKDLQSYYDSMDEILQRSFNKSLGQVVVDPALTSGMFNILDITSTSFVEISPTLTVDFDADVLSNMIVFVPLFANITTLSCVAEIGIQVDGVNDTNVYRFSSNGTTATCVTPVGNLMFPLQVVTSGIHTLKPVARIVSGAAPNLRIRWTDKMKTIVRTL